MMQASAESSRNYLQEKNTKSSPSLMRINDYDKEEK
jgi:ribosomal protein L33